MNPYAEAERILLGLRVEAVHGNVAVWQFLNHAVLYCREQGELAVRRAEAAEIAEFDAMFREVAK